MDVGALRASADRVGVSVRPFSPGDRPGAIAALRDCQAFDDEEVRVATEMIDAGLDGDYHLASAEWLRAFAGYICMGEAPLTQDSWYLYWICVRPGMTGRGIGRKLLRHAEATLCDCGGARLVVETSSRPIYHAARCLYEGSGYRQVGRIPDFYRGGDDCIMYCKNMFGAAG